MTQNVWGDRRLGRKQKIILQLMLDNHLVYPFPLLFHEAKIMETLAAKGFVVRGDDRWNVVPTRIKELEERYDMKVYRGPE